MLATVDSQPRVCPHITSVWKPTNIIQKQTALHDSSKLQKNGFSYGKMDFPAEKDIFLQKNALACRNMWFFLQKMHFPAETCGFRVGTGQETAGNCRKLQEGFWAQESRALPKSHKKIRGTNEGSKRTTTKQLNLKIVSQMYFMYMACAKSCGTCISPVSLSVCVCFHCRGYMVFVLELSFSRKVQSAPRK